MSLLSPPLVVAIPAAAAKVQIPVITEGLDPPRVIAAAGLALKPATAPEPRRMDLSIERARRRVAAARRKSIRGRTVSSSSSFARCVVAINLCGVKSTDLITFWLLVGTCA